MRLIMTSKYEKQIERCLEHIKNDTGINVRVSNDGDRHFIIDDKGNSFGHGESYGELYSSVYFCSEILGFVKTKKMNENMELVKQGNEQYYD